MKNSALRIVSLVFCFFTAHVSGQPVTLDPSFGDHGTVITDFGGGTGLVSGFGALPDGRLRMGGYFSRQGESRFIIFQFLPDGSPDLSFGSAGRVFTDLQGAVEYRRLEEGKFRLYSLHREGDSTVFVIQQFLPDGHPDAGFGPDGKFYPDPTWLGATYPIQQFYLQADLRIVLVLEGDDVLLARLLPDGQPDLSFGHMGIVTTDLSQREFISVVVEVEDGELLVGGSSGSFYWGTFMGSSVILRYQPDGSLDSTFGEGGIVLGTMDSLRISMLTVQQDEKILALSSNPGGLWGAPRTLFMSRYTREGKVDSSFATNGKLSLPETSAHQLEVTTDGHILLRCSKVIGYDEFGYARSGLPIVNRFTPSGQPDTGFGYNGYDTTRLGVQDIVFLQDDTLILCGSYAGEAMLFRFLPDGHADNTFGEGGLLPLHFGHNSSCQLLTLQPNGRLLAAGHRSLIAYDSDIILERRGHDGLPDAGFGNASSPGQVILDFGLDNHVQAMAFDLQADGTISAVGRIDTNLVLYQFKPDGTADPAFSGVGYKILYGPVTMTNWPSRTTYQPDGKILMAGTVEHGGRRKILLQRLDADGSTDEQFGDAGMVVADFPNIDDMWMTSLRLSPDLNIYVAGIVTLKIDPSTGKWAPFVIRFLPNGTLDQSFGTSGISVLTDFPDILDNPAIHVYADGRILLTTEFDAKLHLLRLLPDGRLDPGFGHQGKVTGPFATADNTPSPAIILDDNACIVGGIGYQNGLFFFSCKYLENGALDPSFGTGGKVTRAVSGDYYYFSVYGSRDVLLQKDGKIIFSGSVFSNDMSDFGMIRLDAHGAIDTSFGVNGIIRTDLGRDERLIQGFLQQDNRILLAGTQSNAPSGDFSSIALARYINELNLGIIDLGSSLGEALIYPNPIAEQATLEFELTREDRISIYLTDLQGKVIKTLVNDQFMHSGKHQQSVDVRDIQVPGMFIIRIQGERGSLAVKMIRQ